MSHPSELINTKGHPFVGVQWPVTGSKGDEYTVEMTNYGFDCNCVAWRKCKHIKSVEEKIANPPEEDLLIRYPNAEEMIDILKKDYLGVDK